MNINSMVKSLLASPILLNLGISNLVELMVFSHRERHYLALDEDAKKRELVSWYKKHMGEELDLNAPKNFNQKLQ